VSDQAARDKEGLLQLAELAARTHGLHDARLHDTQHLDPFSIMVKPVGSRCNLRCSYCYYLAKPHLGPARMIDKTLKEMLRQYIAASQGPEVSIVWHGGEPTLAGLDFFRGVVQLEQELLPEGWKCWNNLQTNGVLLDDEWCEFLAANQFDVGLSIDGTSWIHDQYRPDTHGTGSYQAASAAIGRLQAHGLQPDLLCTVTATTAANAVAAYRNLRAFDTGWIQFIPIVNWSGSQLRPESVTGLAYGDFLCDVFDQWAWNDLGRLNIQFFAETMRVLAGGNAGLCWMAPTCGRALVVESDGGVYSCDHFVTPEHKLGNVDALALGVLANSDVQLAFGQAKRDTLPAECLTCPWLRLCNGGCPKDRVDGHNHLCVGLEKFFAHAVPVLTSIIQMTRAGGVPQAIMAQLRAQAAVPWQGVGRNDPCPCGSGRKAKQCCWDKRPPLG